jgi:polyphenol oxidase
MLTPLALGSAFRWSRETWGDALRCVALDPHAQHLFTTRQLQLRGADDGRAWQALVASCAASEHRLVRVKQVHGRTVRVVRAGEIDTQRLAERPEADAIVSNVAGALLAVQVADCVPIIMVDPRVGAAAAVHAGWRGTCAKVAAAAIAALSSECGSRPHDLIVALGPSIGACCYEVGDQLLGEFHGAGAGQAELARWFTRTSSGSLRLDLWAANRDQLMASGVAAEQIHVSRLCTQTHASLFESYRADGARAGRMVAAVKVPHV